MRPRINISLLTICFFVLLFLIGIYKGDHLTVILYLLALLLHETAHLFFAEAFGYQVKEFKLTPLGGCLVVDSLMALYPVAEFVIAFAGPLSNLLMVAGVRYLEFLGVKSSWLEYWGQYNWMLGIINLIPAAPLDGGRLLNALLKKIFSFDIATLITKGIGLFVAGFIFSIGLIKCWTGGAWILYFVTAVFLLYQVVNFQGPKLESFWRMAERRRMIFEKKGYAHLKPILVKPGILIRNFLQRCGGDELLIFLIKKPGGVDLITEETAWDLLINKGYEGTFEEENVPIQTACQNSGK